MAINASLAWLALCVLTVVSWTLATEHAFGTGRHAASLIILVLAVVKARLVGRYFMGLRHAPLMLRWLFDGYCLVLLGVLAGFYCLA